MAPLKEWLRATARARQRGFWPQDILHNCLADLRAEILTFIMKMALPFGNHFRTPGEWRDRIKEQGEKLFRPVYAGREQ